MNILIVSQYYYPENFRITHLAEMLAADGFNVQVLTGLPNYGKNRFYPGYSFAGPYNEERNGVQITRAPILPRWYNGNLPLVSNYLSAAATLTLRALSGRFKDVSLCLVFETSPITIALPAIALRRTCEVPMILWVNDLWPESVAAVLGTNNRLLMKPLEWLTRTIYQNCDAILVKCRSFTENIMSKGVAEADIHYFPDKPDPLFVEPSAASEESIDVDLPDGFRITFAGNIGKAQSMETILEAAGLLQDLPEIQFILIGDGSELETTRRLIEEKGLGRQVTMTGRLPLESMPACYAASDALLVSLADRKVFSLTIPSKLSSYFFSGKPVLGAVSGATAEQIEDSGAGFASPAEDAAALAGNIRKLYSMSAEERKRLGRRARQFAEKEYTFSQYYENLLDLFAQLSGQSRPR